MQALSTIMDIDLRLSAVTPLPETTIDDMAMIVTATMTEAKVITIGLKSSHPALSVVHDPRRPHHGSGNVIGRGSAIGHDSIAGCLALIFMAWMLSELHLPHPDPIVANRDLQIPHPTTDCSERGAKRGEHLDVGRAQRHAQGNLLVAGAVAHTLLGRTVDWMRLTVVPAQ